MQVLPLTTNGFEDSELSYPYYRLQEFWADVHLVAPEAGEIESKHGDTFEADHAIDEFAPTEWAETYDVLVIPGGAAPEALRMEAPAAAEIVTAFDAPDKPITAICHGPQLLVSADILEGTEVAAYWTLEVDIERRGDLRRRARRRRRQPDHGARARRPAVLHGGGAGGRRAGRDSRLSGARRPVAVSGLKTSP